MLAGSRAHRILSRSLRSNLSTGYPSLHLTSVLSILLRRFSISRWRAESSQSTSGNGSHIGLSGSNDAAAWIGELDFYLPLELRSRSWQDNLENFTGVRSVLYLPEILATSDQVFPTGILTHIALVQKRWDAVLYICQAIIGFQNKPPQHHINIFKGSPWSALKAAGPPIDEDFLEERAQLWDIRLFKEPGDPLLAEPSLDDIAGTPFLLQGNHSSLWHSTVGQIWRCLGHVMLAASRENSPLQMDQLGVVLQVIASMHSAGMVSESMYLFEANSVPSTLRKPPFLHLMSSRIMTALSDTMWKKAEPDLMRDVAYVVAKHSHKGDKSPAGEFGPRLRALKHEVWVEFILWSCVHGNHFQEGVELINSMSVGDETSRWRTVPWNVLQDVLDTKLLEQQNIHNAKSWYQRLASSLEGYSEEEPMLDLGRNTVSREVVTRLCDGMLSTLRLPIEQERQPTSSAASCMDILGTPSSATDAMNRKPTLYRMVDDSLDNVLDLAKDEPMDFRRRWNYDQNITTPSIESIQRLPFQADPQYAFLIKALAYHIDNSDVHEAFRSYDKLKVWSGNAPLAMVRKDSDQEDRDTPLVNQIVDIRYLLPTSIRASFISLADRMNMLGVGKTLIAPFQLEDYGPTFTTVDQKSSALSKAVIQLPGDSSNQDDLDELWRTGQFDSKAISKHMVRELLYFQLAKNDWAMTTTLLKVMVAEKRMRILPIDIAKIVSRIIYLESEGKPGDAQEFQKILTRILTHQYRVYQPQGEVPDWSEARQLNQVTRVLASIPTDYFSGLSTHIVHDGQWSTPSRLTIPVFNLILEAVVDVLGSYVGEAIAHTWCIAPLDQIRQQFRPGDLGFRPFYPNLQTFRLLIKPITSRLSASYRAWEAVSDDNLQATDSTSLGDLKADKNSLCSEYEMIVKSYYGEEIEEEQLARLSSIMDMCKSYRFDEGNTFYTLLRPTERIEEKLDQPVQLTIRDRRLEESMHSSTSDEIPAIDGN